MNETKIPCPLLYGSWQGKSESTGRALVPVLKVSKIHDLEKGLILPSHLKWHNLGNGCTQNWYNWNYTDGTGKFDAWYKWQDPLQPGQFHLQTSTLFAANSYTPAEDKVVLSIHQTWGQEASFEGAGQGMWHKQICLLVSCCCSHASAASLCQMIGPPCETIMVLRGIWSQFDLNTHYLHCLILMEKIAWLPLKKLMEENYE